MYCMHLILLSVYVPVSVQGHSVLTECTRFPWRSARPLTTRIFSFFFPLQVAPDTFLSSCDCPNIWVGETFKRDLERSTITLHLFLHWRGRNKSERKKKKEAFSGGGPNIWSAGKHLKLPWLKSHFSSRAVTKWHLKTASLRLTHSWIRIIQLKSLFLLDKGKHWYNRLRLCLACALHATSKTKQVLFSSPLFS